MSAQWIIRGLDPARVEKHGAYSYTFSHRETHTNTNTLSQVRNMQTLTDVNTKPHPGPYVNYTTAHSRRHKHQTSISTHAGG